MIVPRDYLVSAGFIASGLREDDELLKVWAQGCYELLLEATQYAPYCVELANAGAAITDFPGVYDYEVSEAFGRWMREFIFEHQQGPSDEQCRGKLLSLAQAFFHQGVAYQGVAENRKAQIDEALMAVVPPEGSIQ